MVASEAHLSEAQGDIADEENIQGGEGKEYGAEVKYDVEPHLFSMGTFVD